MGFQLIQSSYRAPVSIPSSTTVTLHGTSVNSGNGPLFSGEMNGVSNGLVSGGPPNYANGSSVGSSITGTVFGAVPAAIVFEDGFGLFKTEVILAGSHPQNFFSSMSFTDTTPALETFTSASATYNVFTGTNGTFTSWQWNAIEHYPFGFGLTVVVTFNS